MKKFLALILALILFVGCAGAEMLAGGWTMLDSYAEFDMEGIEACTEAFDKAMTAWTGSEVTLYAPLAKQLVAGMNYLMLVEVSTLTADGLENPHWALMTIYVDHQGEATVTALEDYGMTANPELAGGWTSDVEVEEATNDIIFDALNAMENENMIVYSYFVLNSQLVAGMNYELLCQYVVVNPSEIIDEDFEIEEDETDEIVEPNLSEADEEEEFGEEIDWDADIYGSDFDFEVVKTGLARAIVYVDLSGNGTVTSFEILG